MTERPALRVIPRASERTDDGDDAEASSGPASSKKRATNPEVQAWNEKFSSDPGGTPLGESANRSRDVLAKEDGERRKRTIKIAAAAGGALVVLALLLSFGRSRAPQPVMETEQAVLLDEDIAAEVARRAAVPNAPSCWETDEGYRFEFTGKRGRVETVGTILEVPVLYRLQARCIRE